VCVAQDFNEYFPKVLTSQNHFALIATKNFNWSFGIPRAVRGNHALPVQKQFIAACFVGAMAVPVSDCQYAAAVGYGVYSKGIRSSTGCFRGACQKDSRVPTGRSATWPWMRRGCVLSLRNGGVNEAKKGEAEKIRFVASPTEKLSAPHIADSTPKPLSVPDLSWL
jgi:hypothetical protein